MSRVHARYAGGHAHVVSFLTQSCCAKVGDADFAGDTPLHDAARFGHTECAALLIGARCDVNVLTSAGSSAVGIAARLGHRECVERLVDANADLDASTDSDTPLTAAFNCG